LLGLFGRTAEVSLERPDQSAALRRDVIALDRALGRLPAQQRVLLGLMYFEGESLTAAAALIGTSKGQASKLHKRALATLAESDWESDA